MKTTRKKRFSTRWKSYVRMLHEMAEEVLQNHSEPEQNKTLRRKMNDDLAKTMREQRNRVANEPRLKQ